jgi:hypothetical protein
VSQPRASAKKLVAPKERRVQVAGRTRRLKGESGPMLVMRSQLREIDNVVSVSPDATISDRDPDVKGRGRSMPAGRGGAPQTGRGIALNRPYLP